MSSSWGQQLTIALFGESHGPHIGIFMDGLPAGQPVDLAEIEKFMQRRAPGHSPWSTKRREDDAFSILSGVYQGKTTGTPICAVIENQDVRSGNYNAKTKLPRPSHADFTGYMRYQGANDPRGGGHFSGRLTAPLCFAGAVSKQVLAQWGLEIHARIVQIAEISDEVIDLACPDLDRLRQLATNEFPVLNDDKGQEMIARVEEARQKGDSVGGVVQCFATGIPAGLGDPIFGGVDSKLASILYAIPAVKGVSFGDGFDSCTRTGSKHNDQFVLAGGKILTSTNHDGGINGGITSGMPIVVNVGIKPTPSIAQIQQSINLETMTAEKIKVQGRHDPCIVPRALVAVEAAVAVTILELLLVAYGVQGLAKLDNLEG